MELIRRAYEVMSAGSAFEKDWNWFFTECAHADCELRPAQGRLPDVGEQRIRGRDGFERFWQGLADASQDLRFALEEALPAPEDQIVAVVRATGRGRASGVPLDFREAHVWRMREGKAARIDAYLELDDALRAVSLTQ